MMKELKARKNLKALTAALACGLVFTMGGQAEAEKNLTEITSYTSGWDGIEKVLSQDITENEAVLIQAKSSRDQEANLCFNSNITINSDGNALVYSSSSNITQFRIFANASDPDTISDKVIKIRGNIKNGTLAPFRAYLYLTNANSYFAGKGDNLKALNITLNNNATWYVPASVTSHTLNNAAASWQGGIVDLANTIDATGKQVVRSEAAGKDFSITYESYSSGKADALGGVTFRVKADDTGTTDKIKLIGDTYADDNSSNAPSINVAMVFDKNASSANIKTATYADIISIDDKFKSTYGSSGLTVNGVEYASVVDNGLTKLTVQPTISSGSSSSSYGASGVEVISMDSVPVVIEEEAGPAMAAAKEGATASLGTIAAVRADNNDLMRRMGDLRSAQGEAGSWVRWYGGESEITGGVNYKYNAVQGGYDWDFATSKGKWFTGVTVSHNVGGYGFTNGSGGMKNTMFGVYGSWLGDKGHYADLILKQGRMSNHFNMLEGADYYAGEYKANVTSLSAEYGYRLNLKRKYYLEPQAELTYGHVAGADYQMTLNGAAGPDMHAGSVDSLIGRVGFNLGRETSKGNIYTKLSLAHEFNGDSSISGSYAGTTRSNTSSGKDTWLEFGVGFNQQLGKRLNLYGELDKTTGSVVRNKWRGNVGLRWSF